MTRNTHDRILDHEGTDLDTNVELDGALASPTSTASGQTVHQALSDINSVFRDGGFNVIIGNRSTVITTGIVYEIELPFAGIFTANRLAADQTGSIVVDILKATYSGLFSFSSITASAKPTLSTARKSEDTTLTGWTTAFSAGDWLRFNVDSITTCTQVTLAMRIRRT